jgi:hypothetical protein
LAHKDRKKKKRRWRDLEVRKEIKRETSRKKERKT